MMISEATSGLLPSGAPIHMSWSISNDGGGNGRRRTLDSPQSTKAKRRRFFKRSGILWPRSSFVSISKT